MTGKTFEQVIEIKHILDNLRKKKKKPEDTRNLYFGNTREVRTRAIHMEISENGCCKKSTIVSPQAAEEVPECESLDANEKPSKFLNVLSELV